MPTWKKTQNPDILPWWSQNTDLTQLKQLIEEKAEEWDVEGLNNLLKEVQHNKSLNQEDIKSLETLVNEKIQSIKEQTQEAVNALANTIPHSNQIPAMSENNPTPTDWMWGESNTNSAPSNTDETGLFSETKKWIWETWDDVRNQEKRKTEPWKNTLRTVGFAATWIWALVLAYKWIKWWVNKLKGFFSGENELRKKMGKIETQLAQLNDDFLNERDPTEKNNIRKNIEKLEDMKKEIKEKLAKNLEWNNEDDKAKKEKPWWKKFLIWAWIATWTVIWWVSIYKHWNKISSRVKEKLWLSLTFDEARQKVESEVHNWKVDDDHFWVFNAHFEWWITFDEQTQEICSYWQKTKIDKNSKKLQWMDVEFPSWEELIHAANIVNFAKRMLKWRGENSTPFCQTKWWGDIAFNCSETWKQAFLSANNSNEWSWILWTVWTVGWWLLWWYCAWVQWAAIWAVWWWLWGYALWAYRDNNSSAWRCCATIAKWANFDRFINYLNWQTDEKGESLWEAVGEQRVDSNWSPISGLVDNWEDGTDWNGVLAEIENSFGNDQSWRRILNIEWNETNPEEYKIQSYNHELKLTLKWWPKKKWETIDYSKIESIHLEKYDKYQSRWDWLDIDFPHTEDGLKEAIRVANLTNMIVEDWKWKGWEAYPFAYWRYKIPYNLDIDTDWNLGSTVLSHSKLEQRFPTILNDLWEYPSVSWFFWIQDKMHDQAVHDKREWSQYIKFLHQIWKGNFWKWS